MSLALRLIHKQMFAEHPTDEEIESLDKECEEYLKCSPVRFPKFDISRKTYTLVLILPLFIRMEKGYMFKFLSSEEQGEYLKKISMSSKGSIAQFHIGRCGIS